MNRNQALLFAALGLGAYFLYNQKRNVGPTLSGSGGHERLIDTLLPWVNINPRFKPIISTVAKEIIRGLHGDHIIDADWRKL